MQITREQWKEMFNEVAVLMIANKDLLSDIDAKFGDGDHGITVEKIGNALRNKADEWYASEKPLKLLFEEIGVAVTNINGGSAGPLYGTYFGGLGEILKDEVEVDGATLKKILKSGLIELQYLSTAKVGDKTMMDTLIPATDAAYNSSDNIIDILTNAKDAAIQGAEKSKEFVSKFGRARSYKEQTIGTKDAGAESCTYIFIGFYNAIVK